MAIVCNEALENFNKYLPMNATGDVTELDIDFSTF